MRILTPKEFTKEPYGTVYIRYIPRAYADQPKIKSEPRGKEFGQTWWATDVLPWVTDNEEFDKQENNKNYELKTEGFCTDDAIYNHDKDELYIVYSKEEIKQMIDRLTESLTDNEYNK